MTVFSRIFSSRKVWIALAAVAMCIITILGADPEKWAPLITAIVTLASVVIAAIGFEDGAAKLGTGEILPVIHDAKNDAGTLGGKPPGGLPAILLIGLMLMGVGCQNITPVSVQADQARKNAVEPVILEHVQRHPEQAQTWEDFLWAWQRSIDSRQSAVGGGQQAKPLVPNP